MFDIFLTQLLNGQVRFNLTRPRYYSHLWRQLCRYLELSLCLSVLILIVIYVIGLIV